MKEAMKGYVYAIYARKLSFVCVIMALSIFVLRLSEIENASQEELLRKIEETEGKTTWQGKVTSIQLKEGYNGEYYSVTLKDVYRLYENAKEPEPVTIMGQSILVYMDSESDIKIGQRVTVSGEAACFRRATNYGQFDAYRYYSNRGCLFCVKNAYLREKSVKYSILSDRLFRFRISCGERLDMLYGSEDGAILKAMLLGVKSDIDEDIRESFQKSGAAHILAISGLHISFLCMTLTKLLAALGMGRYLRLSVSIGFLSLYVMMVGVGPSALRASVMFVMFMIAGVLKRSYDMITAMSAAAIVILFTNTGYLGDMGFLLSFLAILAVGVFARLFIENSCYIKKLRKLKTADTISGIVHNFFVRYVFDAIIISGFIFLTSAPALLYCYYEVAFYSVVLNLIIIPLMSVLLVSAILALILTAPVYAFGVPFLHISRAILFIYKYSCGILEMSGLGRRNLGQPSPVLIVIYYLLLIFICLYPGKFKALVRLIAMGAALTILCFHNNSNARLDMLDVGQGDCLVFFNDNGNVYLFDGGSSSDENVGENVIIPFLKYSGVDEVEAVFVSHPDNDHVNGIIKLLDRSVKECIHIRNIYVYEDSLKEGQYHELERLALRDNTKLTGISAGSHLIDDRLKVECIYPSKGVKCEDINDRSLVLRLRYGDFSFLETGDIGFEAEEKITGADISCDCLKVAHHGSASSSSEAFLENTGADLAIISAGRRNRYGHPSPQTLERLITNDINVICTAQSGQITIYCRDKGIEVNTYNHIK